MTALNNRYILTTLLSCTALAAPSLAFSSNAIPAKTSWAVSRVASVSQGSYCTMAQKFEDATVLSFARNSKGEYSLALDFADPKFKVGEKQTVTLRPQGGAAQTYSVTPQSDKTAVIGIGKDAQMMEKISSAGVMGIETGGASMSYALSQFSSGQKELGDCIDALKTTNEKDAELVASAKTGVTSPDATVNRQVAVVRSLQDNEPSSGGANEPSVEGLLAAKPTPSTGISALSSEDVKPVPVAPKNAPVKIAEPAVDTKMIEQVASLREENARLTRVVAEQRQNFEDQQAALNGAASDELRQKLDAAQAENSKLRAQLSQLSVAGESTGAEQKAQLARLMGEVDKANQTAKALEAENATLRNQIGVYQSKQEGLAKNTSEAQTETDANAKALAELQKENAQLKAQISSKSSAPDLTAELARQKQSNEALLAENNTLKNQIQIYASKPKDVATPVAAADSEEATKLRSELRTLRGQFETAQADRAALQTQLAELQKKTEGAQIKMAGGSWDLEQATRRYQESQREIQRLGTIIQTQEAKCTAEKKDIEYMLFDPAIAKSSQISMLNSLEDQITEKDKKIKEIESELATTKAQASLDKDKKIQDLQAQLKQQQDDMTKQLAKASSAQDSVIASLKNEIAKKDKDIFDVQSKLANAENQAVAGSEKDKALNALKSEVAQKNEQLAKMSVAQEGVIASLKNEIAKKDKDIFDIQSKLANAQNEAAATTEKDKTLMVLKSELDQKNAQLADAQSKIEQFAKGQSTMSATQEATINTLKSQLANTQAQLEATRVAAQQVSANANADQAATLANLQMQVQQGNQRIAELQNQMGNLKVASVQAASVAPAAAPTPVPVAAPPVPSPVQNISFSAKSAPTNFMSKDEFSGLLKKSGVPVNGGLDEVKGGDPSSYRAYSWKTSSLYGSVEMRRVTDESAFDSVIGQYLSRAKSRCSGEFAAVPASVKASNVEQSKAYEIACVGQDASSSASVLFTYGNGVAMTVAHEGRAEAMDLAMDARDKISTQIH